MRDIHSFRSNRDFVAVFAGTDKPDERWVTIGKGKGDGPGRKVKLGPGGEIRGGGIPKSMIGKKIGDKKAWAAADGGGGGGEKAAAGGKGGRAKSPAPKRGEWVDVDMGGDAPTGDDAPMPGFDDLDNEPIFGDGGGGKRRQLKGNPGGADPLGPEPTEPSIQDRLGEELGGLVEQGMAAERAIAGTDDRLPDESRMTQAAEAAMQKPKDYWGSPAQPYWRAGPNPTVDLVMTRDGPMGPEVLLIKRADGAAEGGKWALPGGFHDSAGGGKGTFWEEGKETSEDAALRELTEETGAALSGGGAAGRLQHVGLFDDHGRDPRDNDEAWAISNAYSIHVTGDEANQAVAGQDDAQDAQWTPLDDLPSMAFDHDSIIAKMRSRGMAGDAQPQAESSWLDSDGAAQHAEDGVPNPRGTAAPRGRDGKGGAEVEWEYDDDDTPLDIDLSAPTAPAPLDPAAQGQSEMDRIDREYAEHTAAQAAKKAKRGQKGKSAAGKKPAPKKKGAAAKPSPKGKETAPKPPRKRRERIVWGGKERQARDLRLEKAAERASMTDEDRRSMRNEKAKKKRREADWWRGKGSGNEFHSGEHRR